MIWQKILRSLWGRVFPSSIADGRVPSGCAANDNSSAPAVFYPGASQLPTQTEPVGINDSVVRDEGHSSHCAELDLAGEAGLQKNGDRHGDLSRLQSCRVHLHAARLSRRQLQTAEVLLELALKSNQGVASFARLDDLAAVMGTTRPHVHRWLHDLARYRIIWIERRGRQSDWRVAFQLDRQSWSVGSFVRPSPAEYQPTITLVVPIAGPEAGTTSFPPGNADRILNGNPPPAHTDASAKPQNQADQVLSQAPLGGHSQQIKPPCPKFDPNVHEELLVALNDVMGTEWPKYENLWQGRCRKFPRTVEEALAELKVRKEHPTLPAIVTPGGWLNGEFKRILGEAPRLKSVQKESKEASQTKLDSKKSSGETAQSSSSRTPPMSDLKPVKSTGDEAEPVRPSLDKLFALVKEAVKRGSSSDTAVDSGAGPS